MDNVEKFKATMVLSGVGDALGYKHGHWEFNRSGLDIHKELSKMGGLEKLSIELPDWNVSDDTVMHIATARGLVKFSEMKSRTKGKRELYLGIAKEYIHCMADMEGRAPGATSIDSVDLLDPSIDDGYMIPFNEQGGGCGGAMRAMCIGLYYARPEDLDDLIAVSIESGRMTHSHPTGFLGALASALFTSYAIRSKPVQQWGYDLMQTMERAWSYVESQNRDLEENEEHWLVVLVIGILSKPVGKYLKNRGIEDGKTLPIFPVPYGVAERDLFYKSVSYNGTGGASGHDAPMIAYDALLGSGNNWNELCYRGVLHGGDSDSTGAIAGAWFGALYGFGGVPKNPYKKLEYRRDLEELAYNIFRLRPGSLH